MRGQPVEQPKDVASLDLTWDTLKDPDGPRLGFSPEAWRVSVAGVKAGELGLG